MKTVSVFITTILFGFACLAQKAQPAPSAVPDLANGPNAVGVQDEPPSIYYVNPWATGALVGGTNLLTLSAFGFQNNLINKRCPCDPNEVNQFDRFAIYDSSPWAGTAADIMIGLSLATPIVVDYLDIGLSRAFAEDMAVFVETMSVDWFLVAASKFGFQRPLPYLYAEQTQGTAGDYLSFYSGHTCTTVAALASMSMTYDLRHGFHWWPWIITGAAGAFVGYDMVAAAKHFPTDVIVGFVMGSAVGYVVPHLHAKNQVLTVSPVEGGGAVALWTKQL